MKLFRRRDAADLLPWRSGRSRSMKRSIAMLFAAVFAASAGAAPTLPPEIEGTVVRVVDGDTLLVAPAEGEAITVRLQGIDAPEICQPHGSEAKQALEELVLKQAVRARPTGIDSHGRTLAKVVRGAVDVGDRLVRDGHAWSHRYRDDKGPYVMQERMARALLRGVHASGQAITPREFRKRNGPCLAPAPQPGASIAAS
jgi:endonuclease YncB( thermonuclease family)